jgi:LEA14-like dessication related protein
MLMRTPPRRRLMVGRWALAGSLCLAACSLMAPKLERPTVSVIGIDLTGGNLLQQHLRVKFNIQNPNDRALPVNGLQASLSVGGEEVAEGRTDRAFMVPAQGNADFDMMISANLGLALLKLRQMTDQHAGTIDYDLRGSASVDLPFLREVPFHQGGVFSLNDLSNLLK